MNSIKHPAPESLARLLRQHWLGLLGVAAALALLALASAEWLMIPRSDRVENLRTYLFLKQLPGAACCTSIAGIGFLVAIIVSGAVQRIWRWDVNTVPVQPSGPPPKWVRSNAGYFKPVQPAWTEKPAANLGHKTALGITVWIVVLASAIAAWAAITTSFRIPGHMKTVKLNHHTYLLAQQPTGDWDANEIDLYECADSTGVCHLLHTEYTHEPDHIDLRVDSEANTVLMVIHDYVVFTHPSPTD